MVIVWSIVQAVFVRIVLFIHSFLCIWRAVDVTKERLIWLLGLGNILHIVELEHRILKKRGEEDKWFCPCFFIHLLNTIPAIWLLEFDRLNRQQIVADDNSTFTTPATNSSNDHGDAEALSSIEGITIPIYLDADTWASVLEQGFLFILILGRWILPRGKLTRDQLSQLLFVYIGSGSDVMELFIIFEEPSIRSDKSFSYAILAIWTFSLLQFTLVLTSTRKERGGHAKYGAKGWRSKPEQCCARLVELEIWSLFVAMVLQDGPYLTIRLCAIFIKNVYSYGIIFFSLKNGMMIMMLMYRVLVVGTHEKELKLKEIKKEQRESKIMEQNNLKRTNTKEMIEDPSKNQDKNAKKFGGPKNMMPMHYWPNSNYFYDQNYGFPGSYNAYGPGYY